MEIKRTKTEAELITTVANIHDAEACLRYAQRAMKAGMPALAAACEERVKTLKPFKTPSVKKTGTPRSKAAKAFMKTHIVAEQALPMLIEDYKAGLQPTTYGELAVRCGFESRKSRWFGQVTDLIDAACALSGVPSFALVRVRESANGNVNDRAWRSKEYSHLRDPIIAKAKAGKWTDEDFTKIHDALAVFSAHRFGNKKAWDYVHRQIKVEEWAAAAE